jgi:hypothetical protein
MLPTHLEHIRSLTDLSVKRGFVERGSSSDSRDESIRDESIRAARGVARLRSPHPAKPKRDRLRAAQSSSSTGGLGEAQTRQTARSAVL